MKKKTAKEVKMHKYLVCACKSQDFVQSQNFFARLHDRVTVTFRNSVIRQSFSDVSNCLKAQSSQDNKKTFLTIATEVESLSSLY